MAKIARCFIVWQSAPKTDEEGNALSRRMLGIEMDEPDTDRVEIALEGVVPDIVPEEVVAEWEAKKWVYEDPTRERIAAPEGPPRMLMPVVAAQKLEHAKKMGETPKKPNIPPRPQ